MLTAPTEAPPLLDIRDLRVELTTARGRWPVLEGINLRVEPGETVGIVGESGCGKSVLSLSLLGLLPPAMRISEGEIRYEAGLLPREGEEAFRRIRGREIAMIFQDPMSSLNPALTIGEQATEMTRLHLKLTKREAREHAVSLFRKVGLPRPEALLKEYPHQLSGGMLQRVMIAVALSCAPKLLIADEPTTALDVTIQAQILELLKTIREEDGTAILLVSHDLGVIADMCDRIAVMYAGQVVEEGTAEELFDSPRHPYTQGLLQAVPTPAKKREKLLSIPGTVPALHERGAGCRFHSRCAYATEQCLLSAPPVVRVSGAGGGAGLGTGAGAMALTGAHAVRCWLAAEEGGLPHAAG